VDGRPYSDEDRSIGQSLSSHLGLALKSASLLEDKNKRIDELSVLLQISREITSTLDLERVLNTIVQMLGMVVPNRRATIALATSGGLSLRASSEPGFSPKGAKSDPLLTVLHWVHGARQPLNTSQTELEQDPDAEGRDVVLPVLSREGGPRGLSVLSLQDEEGVVGLLAIETDEDAPPLDDDHDELVNILANQTTVAIRNAELYQRVPMIGVLEPMLGKAKQATDMGSRKKRIRLAVIAALIIAGFVVPTPTWVSGDAEVRPAAPVAVRAPTEGTIREVLVDEGQRVSAGAVLGRIRDDDVRVELERVRSATQRLHAEAARARSQHDLATYRAREASLREHAERERFLETELERAILTAPVDGVVLTTQVELRQGEHLDIGATFLELADLSRMEIEVQVSENDIQSIKPGSSARLKVHAHPGRTFRGEVARIAPRAGADRHFLVTVGIENADEALRPGMTGRAHIESPSRPLFARMFRPLIRGLRLRLWM
jgi:multidrug resistance efflux pump